MRIAFDAFSVRTGTTAIVLENLLRGWRQSRPDDELIVLAMPAPQFTVPDGVRLELRHPPAGGQLGSLWFRSVGLRRHIRSVRADRAVSLVTASALLGTAVRRAAIVYDLRHEQRPHQFSPLRRIARRVSYAWAFRTADVLCCISRRTYDDLVGPRPGLREKAVVTLLGSDHVLGWSTGAAMPPAPDGSGSRPYALAFGHFANKNAGEVIAGWAEFCRTDERLVLRLVGMSGAERERSRIRVHDLGIDDRVEIMGWLDDAQFAGCFAGAALVVYPSDFEGFGLPAVEAMRLGIPLVVSADPALAEVTGGHAVVAPDVSAPALADAIHAALARDDAQLRAARDFAEGFDWAATAESVRAAIA